MSKIDKILTLIQVIKEGSFSQAAQKLGISNAAVSKQVSQLEAELGLQILNRTTRKISLTEAGGIYYELSKKLIDDLEEMDNFVFEIKSEPIGRLRVTSQRQFGEEYIVPHLSDFLTSFPKVHLELELGEYFPDLEKGNIDILIGMSRPGSLSEIHRKIGTTHYVMCAAPVYLKKYGTPKTPKEMLSHRYINHAIRRPVDRVHFKGDLEITLAPYLLLNDTRAMLNAAIQGLGIVKLHAYVVQEALNRGALVEILKNFAEPVQPIYVSYRAQKFVPPKIRCFIDYFVAKFQAHHTTHRVARDSR